MKPICLLALGIALSSCDAKQPSPPQVDGAVADIHAEPTELASPAEAQTPTKPQSKLPIWQSVGLMLGTSEEEAESIVTKVLGAHNVVASDENIKNMVGALLVFRDQDSVAPLRVLTCMDSGVRSPFGPAWQETMAYCVTELAS